MMTRPTAEETDRQIARLMDMARTATVTIPKREYAALTEIAAIQREYRQLITVDGDIDFDRADALLDRTDWLIRRLSA